MRNILAVFLLFFITLLTSNARADEVRGLFKRAEKEFYQENFKEARNLFVQVIKIDATYKIAEYKAEVCALMTTHRTKSLEYLFSFEKIFHERYKFYYYWLGRIYFERYRFQDAIDTWNFFLTTHRDITEDLRLEVADFLEWARSMEDFYSSRESHGVHQLEGGINTNRAELTPAYYSDKKELIYASSYGGDDENEFFIYHTYQSGKYLWSQPKIINTLGSFTRKNVNIEVVDNHQKLFLFKFDKGGNLHVSNNVNGVWEAPVGFNSKIKKSNLESHFFINDDEDRIIFVSTKTGDVQKDLYESLKDENGTWSIPLPLSNAINSDYDEDSPYLTPDGKTLYFSSRGHTAVGGYDVFKSNYDLNSGRWTHPQNLGYPINTIDNEVHFKTNRNSDKEGYFCSDRLGSKGDYDIYFFWETENLDVEGRVLSHETKEPVPHVDVHFRPHKLSEERFRHKADDEGTFIGEIIKHDEYIVEISDKEKVIHRETLVIDSLDSAKLKKDFYVKKENSDE